MHCPRTSLAFFDALGPWAVLLMADLRLLLCLGARLCVHRGSRGLPGTQTGRTSSPAGFSIALCTQITGSNHIAFCRLLTLWTSLHCSQPSQRSEQEESSSGSALSTRTSQETRRERPRFKQEADDVRDEETFRMTRGQEKVQRARAELVRKTPRAWMGLMRKPHLRGAVPSLFFSFLQSGQRRQPSSTLTLISPGDSGHVHSGAHGAQRTC